MRGAIIWNKLLQLKRAPSLEVGEFVRVFQQKKIFRVGPAIPYNLKIMQRVAHSNIVKWENNYITTIFFWNCSTAGDLHIVLEQSHFPRMKKSYSIFCSPSGGISVIFNLFEVIACSFNNLFYFQQYNSLYKTYLV